jgi:hypothetical protein
MEDDNAFMTQEDDGGNTAYLSWQEDSQDPVAAWGTVDLLMGSKRVIRLNGKEVHFGRYVFFPFKIPRGTFFFLRRSMANIPNKSPEDQFVFIGTDDVPDNEEFNRISNHHFTIRLLNDGEKQALGYTHNSVPACIISQGRLLKY